MQINLTDKQFEQLLKLVYLGEYMLNSSREKPLSEYEMILSHICGYAKENGLEKYVMKEDGIMYPSEELDTDTVIEGSISGYNEDMFRRELIDKLAMRDFEKKYGEAVLQKMSIEEILSKQKPFIEKRENEMEDFGLDRLQVG